MIDIWVSTVIRSAEKIVQMSCKIWVAMGMALLVLCESCRKCKHVYSTSAGRLINPFDVVS